MTTMALPTVRSNFEAVATELASEKQNRVSRL